MKLRYHQGAILFYKQGLFLFCDKLYTFTHHAGVENDLVEFRLKEIALYSKDGLFGIKLNVDLFTKQYFSNLHIRKMKSIHNRILGTCARI